MPASIVEEMTFNEGVQRLAKEVDYRRIVDDDDREAVYRLRYDSYLREGAIAANEFGRITDRFDLLPNSHVFGIYIESRLASTIRLSLGSPRTYDIPAMACFPDALKPFVDRDATFMDPTRFVLDWDHARHHPKLAHVTMRLAWIVSDHLGIDYGLASVRTEHQAFYRRFFGHTLLCPARPYPSLIKPLGLMIFSSRDLRERSIARYPFLNSTRAEFEALAKPATWVADRAGAFGTLCDPFDDRLVTPDRQSGGSKSATSLTTEFNHPKGFSY